MPQAEEPCKGNGSCVWEQINTLCSTCWARWYVLNADQIDEEELRAIDTSDDFDESDDPYLARQVLDEWEQDALDEEDLVALNGGWF